MSDILEIIILAVAIIPIAVGAYCIGFYNGIDKAIETRLKEERKQSDQLNQHKERW